MIAGELTYSTKMDTSGFQKGVNGVKSIIAGLGITKIIGKAFDVLTNSIDGAISRIDILNNFPKVMSNLGIGAEESKEAIDDLSKRLQGIPTTLDDAALAVQRFTSKNGDVRKSVDIFDAVNNAILAGGASADIQRSALEQLSQAYAKGKPDMMEWRTLQTAMPAQLKQVATAMGMTTEALGDNLRTGKISMNDFIAKIVEMNKTGSAEFKSFSEQARNATGGIKTGITNAKTAVVRGVGSIISSINDSLINSGIGSIGDIFTKVGKTAESALKFIGEKVKEYAPIIIDKVKDIIENVKNWLKDINFKQILQNIWQTVKFVVEKIVNAIKPIYTFIKDKIIPAIKDLLKSFGETKLDTSSFEKISEILENLAPLINGVIVGFLAFKTITFIVGVIQAIQKALVSLTSTIAMNPWAALLAAIVAVGVALRSVKSEAGQALEAAQSKVASTLSNMSKAFEEYGQAIDGAKGNLDGFSTTLFATSEEQAKIENELRTVQDNMTRIAKRAHEERRELTQSEIDKLNEYLEKLKELRAQQVELEKALQGAIVTQAKESAKKEYSTLEEYNKISSEYISKVKTQEENITKIVQENATEQIAYLDLTYDTEEKRSTEAYKTKRDNIIKERDEAITAAKEKTTEVVKAFGVQGRKEAQVNKDSLRSMEELSKEYKQLRSEYKAFKDEQEEAGWNPFLNITTAMESGFGTKMEDLKEEMASVQEEITKIIDDETAKRIGIWLQQKKVAKESGEELSMEEKRMAWDIINTYKNMGGNVTGLTDEMIQTVVALLGEGSYEEFVAAENAANGITEPFENLPKEGSESTDEFVQSINKLLHGAESSFKAEGENLAENIASGLDSLQSKGEEAGQNFISGIMNSIKNRQGSLITKAHMLGVEMVNALNKGQDAHSPSRKTYKAGINFLQGFSNAIKDNENKAYAEMQSFGDNLVNKMSNAVNIETDKVTAKALLAGNIDKSVVINANFTGNVEMDNKKVGRILAPDISQALKVGGL